MLFQGDIGIRLPPKRLLREDDQGARPHLVLPRGDLPADDLRLFRIGALTEPAGLEEKVGQPHPVGEDVFPRVVHLSLGRHGLLEARLHDRVDLDVVLVRKEEVLFRVARDRFSEVEVDRPVGAVLVDANDLGALEVRQAREAPRHPDQVGHAHPRLDLDGEDVVVDPRFRGQLGEEEVLFAFHPQGDFPGRDLALRLRRRFQPRRRRERALRLRRFLPPRSRPGADSPS